MRHEITLPGEAMHKSGQCIRSMLENRAQSNA